MILSQTLTASIGLSVGLLSFCAGAALAVWGSSNHISNTAGAKLAGHFVALLSVIVLVFTSYSITIGLLNNEVVYDKDTHPAKAAQYRNEMHKMHKTNSQNQ